MNLSDALDEVAAGSSKHGARCAMAILLESLPVEDAEKLRSLVDHPLPSGRWVEASRIAVVLREQGFDVSSSSVQRHRRRVKGLGDACLCPI